MNMVETAIIGGGPAGAAAACGLAVAGHDVVVIERSAVPHHKVCGEFLSVETQAILRHLGIDVLAAGAVPIDRVAIHVGSRAAVAALPFRALSLSRRRLDQALLDRAQALGASIVRGVAVQAVSRDAGGWAMRCDDGQVLHARNLILATGKQGLRGISDSRDGSLVGLKMHLRLGVGARAAIERRVELFMLERSYVGLELIEDGVANLCLVMARELAAEVGAGWPALRAHLIGVSSRLAQRLDGAEPLLDKPLAVVCPAGGHLNDDAAPEIYRVGDRLAHIPPFTGDGLAIAVASGTLAAGFILQQRSPAEYLAAARALTAGPIRLAGMISRLAASRAGRALIGGAAAVVPGIVAGVARRTRLPAAALPMQSQDDSYAPIRAKTGGGISARSSAG
jgi:flavin-dependent dehydrogenase